jgi:hypothetical protein
MTGRVDARPPTVRVGAGGPEWDSELPLRLGGGTTSPGRRSRIGRGRRRVGPADSSDRGRSVSVIPATRGVHVRLPSRELFGYDNLARPSDATGESVPTERLEELVDEIGPVSAAIAGLDRPQGVIGGGCSGPQRIVWPTFSAGAAAASTEQR